MVYVRDNGSKMEVLDFLKLTFWQVASLDEALPNCLEK